MTDEILDVEEVATLLKLHKNTIYRFCKEGVLPHQKFGQQLRFSKNAVVEKLNQNFIDRNGDSSDTPCVIDDRKLVEK